METIGKFSVVVLTFGLLVATNAWPSGAPDTACNSFRPWHTDADDKPYRAENEDHVGRDDVNCPYSLTASSDFIPGQSITLTLAPKQSNNTFKGYILSVVEYIASNNSVNPVGSFSADQNGVCNGAAVTHSDGNIKSSVSIEWTSPADAAGRTFNALLTVVESHNRFWIDCGDIDIHAFDAVRDDTEVSTQKTISLKTATEADQDDDDHTPSIFNTHKNNTDKASAASSHDIEQSKDDDKDGEDSADSLSSEVISASDPNSVDNDKSGNSIENSVDISDNRSGSSLNSEEKEGKRQKYLEEGIQNFNGDIQKIFTAIGKPELFKTFSNDAMPISSAYSICASITFLVFLFL